ncbi:MAG: hypothetical protein HDR11_07205 [Lachnospiraceae bacterium]|nr:hypothetical protein [Lachnospiraceae bacterium]
MKCIEDEIPFEVPEGWEWCRLKDLFYVCSSKRVLQSDWQKEGIPFYRAREIVKLSYDGYVKNDLFISEEHYETLKEKYGVPKAGDLMVTGVGTIGKVYIVQENDIFYYKDASVLCFENLFGGVISAYAKIMIESCLLQLQIHSRTYGNTVDTITISTANDYLCILPPIAEQKRIVLAVKKALNLVNYIEINKFNLTSNIKLAKSCILDLAIRGKLVPQDPNDEPASVLLERIRAKKEKLIKQGKIKRDKKESIIFKGDDNSYYDDIPENWEAVSMVAIAEVELGKTLDITKNTGEYHPYLRSINIKWNSIDLSDIKEMKFEPEELERYAIQKGDLLICEGGDVGRCCIWNDDATIFYQNALHRVRFYENCNPKFFLFFMMYLESIGYLKQISNGVTIKHLTKNVLASIPFLLPPISEQARIVEAIEIRFALLNQIAESLA